MGIGFKNVDGSIDEWVDFILIGIRDKVGGIVYICKFCYLDREIVSVLVMILNMSLDKNVYFVFVNYL